MCKLVNTKKLLKRKFYEVEINLQQGKRIGKRKRDSAYKDEIEKKNRLLKSCHEFLKIIAPSVNKDALENLLTEEKFCDIEVQQNHLVDSLRHRTNPRMREIRVYGLCDGARFAVPSRDKIFRKLGKN